jgi:hypothetical protein
LDNTNQQYLKEVIGIREVNEAMAEDEHARVGKRLANKGENSPEVAKHCRRGEKLRRSKQKLRATETALEDQGKALRAAGDGSAASIPPPDLEGVRLELGKVFVGARNQNAELARRRKLEKTDAALTSEFGVTLEEMKKRDGAWRAILAARAMDPTLGR